MAASVRIAETILAGRNAYDYPPIGLIARDANATSWRKRYQAFNFPDSLRLDRHHTDCLNSHTDADVLNGIFSVMYWGNVTAGKKCETRCDWLESGNRRFPEQIGKDRARCCRRNRAGSRGFFE
jgi:hypothetical protein